MDLRHRSWFKKIFSKDYYNAYIVSSKINCVLHNIEFVPVELLRNKDSCVRNFLYWETYYNQSDILLISNSLHEVDSSVKADVNILIRRTYNGYEVDISDCKIKKSFFFKGCLTDKKIIKKLYKQLISVLA